jgi:molybdopterin molybdotransferase
MRLRNAGRAQARPSGSGTLEPETCLQIRAGTTIPSGADAVVPLEQARDGGEGFVEFAGPLKVGQYIERRSALVTADSLLARAGTRINALMLASLIAGGAKRVTVFARPRVAQLTTSDEPAAPGRDLKDGQVHDGNSLALEELIRQAGGETVMFGRCPEEPAALRASLELGLANDVLCLTGCLSQALHDPLPGLLEELGVCWLIRGARLRPGKTLRIGQTETGCWVAALPGNPVGCAACFLLFARELLVGLQGLEVRQPPHLYGVLKADLPANDAQATYQPAEWSAGPEDAVQVSPLAWRGPGDPFAMATANALIHRPAGAPAASGGESVPFVPFDLPR